MYAFMDFPTAAQASLFPLSEVSLASMILRRFLQTEDCKQAKVGPWQPVHGQTEGLLV